MIQFELQKGLIAQEPAHPRDTARLLVYDRKTKQITDTIFRELPNFLAPYSTLVINDSKVENCRWLFPEKKIEIFVLNKLDLTHVKAMVRPGRKFKLGITVDLTESITAKVLSIDREGLRTLELSVQHDDPRLKKYEHIPLPPYITQNDDLAPEYQTVYAKPLGSKAAPTAGLHFTDKLLEKIKKDHEICKVTLHVGLGTFAPLTEENITLGKLHPESYEINSGAAEKIRSSLHITAVGTTSARALETFAASKNVQGETDIFIRPGYEFKRVNSLVTNFHLPGTSLLLLVEAFVGDKQELQKIYDHAIKEKYRFYSFGDAMLII